MDSIYLRDWDEALPDPHYSNSYFKTARTVYGSKSSELAYEYSDRLVPRDYDRHIESVERAKASSHVSRSPAWYQEYLRGYFQDETLVLAHVMAGFNLSNGHPYYVFGFKKGSET